VSPDSRAVLAPGVTGLLTASVRFWHRRFIEPVHRHDRRATPRANPPKRVEAFEPVP
jgi:hypothetical protein